MISNLVAIMLQATAPQAGDARLPIVELDWIKRPTGEDFANHYPSKAASKGLAARVVMSCSATAGGTLSNCTIVEEFPADIGFGEAVLKMAPLFRMRPTTKSGQPVAGGTVRIPMRFVTSPGQSIDPLSAMLACYGQTAAAAEKGPSTPELAGAYTFFAGQAALRQGETKASPTTFEANLAEARQAALAAEPRVADGLPSLKTCLELFRSRGAKRG